MNPHRRRFDSLFMRLFLLQLALVLTVVLVFGLLFYVERSRSIATLQAQVWAGVLQQALPPLAAQASTARHADPAVLRRADAPPQRMRPRVAAPRIEALRSALLAQGIPVRDIALSREDHGTVTWLQIDVPGEPLAWYGLSGHLIEPRWPARLLLALAAVGVLLAVASWAYTRRLTRPLERLRDQMRRGDMTAPHPGGAATPKAPPEIAEIEAAHLALLLAGVSHDLRSPLARIRLAVELMPPHEDSAARRASIVRNVATADQLVESFVDFVRTGELPLDEAVDLQAVVQKVVMACERPTAELATQLSVGLVLPVANALLVERLVGNLIDNAFKHGRPPVEVRLFSAGDAACLEVHDAGAGISPGEREDLQQAFARGDASRGVAGTGLGLAIARQVVMRLGGSLSFETTASGHVARVSLPRSI